MNCTGFWPLRVSKTLSVVERHGGFMKFGLLLTFLLMSQLAIGQTLNAKKVKAQMLDRIDTLSIKIDETTEALEIEDMVLVCERLNEIFKILPDHLIAIGTKLNIFNGKVIKMEQETKMNLIYIHQQRNICEVGETGEFLKIKDLNSKLKSIKKSFAKQKKTIKKLDTDYSNAYHYNYKF